MLSSFYSVQNKLLKSASQFNINALIAIFALISYTVLNSFDLMKPCASLRGSRLSRDDEAIRIGEKGSYLQCNGGILLLSLQIATKYHR